MNTENTITHQPLYKVIGEIAGLWTIANLGYYIIFPIFGINISYNSSPVFLALYYLLFAIIIVYYFWDVFREWLTANSHIWLYGFLSLVFGGLLYGAVYLFSFLPIPHGPLIAPYTDILFATPWYFLPKAVEILVQQLLITVLILELYHAFKTLKEVIVAYAVCFGGAHIALFFFNGSSTDYSIIMTVGALLTSLIFPRLILNVRGGFVYTFMVHFVFYILLATILHIVPPPGYII